MDGQEDPGPVRPSRFKPKHSPGLDPLKWSTKALSHQGWRHMTVGNGVIYSPTFFANPQAHLSMIGYELYVIGTVTSRDDPVHAMAEAALENWCGVAYGALLDLLEEDGTFPADDFVPSRFSALLMRSGLTGVEADRVVVAWTARRRCRDRMVKALEQGVEVVETTRQVGGGPGAAVQGQTKWKTVRVKRRARSKV